MRILFPTDFSELAEKALTYSDNLAEVLNAEITLLHAFPTPTLQAHSPGDLITDILQQREEDTLQRLDVWGRPFKNVKGAYAIPGGLQGAIAQLLKNEDFDLIVMGTHGAAGFIENLLGNNTFAILNDQEKALLAIPAKAKYDQIDQIVYATDYEQSDVSAIRNLEYLCSKFNARMTILHIGEGPEVFSKELSKIYFGTAAAFESNERINFEFYNHDDLLEGIHEYTVQNKTDLLSLKFKKHNFFVRLFSQDHSKKILLHTTLPMLIFHED